MIVVTLAVTQVNLTAMEGFHSHMLWNNNNQLHKDHFSQKDINWDWDRIMDEL